MGVDVGAINLALFPADQINMYGAAHIFNCKNCGKQYYNKRHRFNGEGEQYCSKACAYAHRRGIYSPNYTSKVMSPLLTLYYKPCEWCGVLVKSGPHPRRMFCSREHDVLQKKRDNYQVNSQKKVLKARACRYCNKNFIPEYGNKRRNFCSDKCLKKFNRGSHDARAKRFGVAKKYFNVMRIFQRDKWRCQLCGISTPKRLKGKNQPNSPELDHILPLSQGGGHIVENVQCACRRCNGLKGNKALGQLWFIGLADSYKRNKINTIAHQNLQKSAPCRAQCAQIHTVGKFG